MSKKWLADAYRRLGKAEHAVERRMLDHADNVPDPEHMRERAGRVSDNGRRHLAKADRPDDGPSAIGPDVT